jgi:gamma-glutamyltranspeptidase/glutathione hydrolase
MPVLAPHGVVATSNPLAAQAGLRMLLAGGNAVDAAVATATTLTVLEPWVNGIGSDAFAIVWDGQKLHGLNASGKAPAAHTPELFAKLGHERVPNRGWLSVIVPGAPAAWRDLHARFGRLDFERLFEPAIDYARNGFPLAPETAFVWAQAQRGYLENIAGVQSRPLFEGRAERSYIDKLEGSEFRGWFETFMPEGRVAAPGDMWTLPDHAQTLERIAGTGAQDFYRGDSARAIAAFAAETGGHVTEADMAAYATKWVEPICAHYRGYDVWEIPPNGQGIAALEALSILEGFDLGSKPRDSVESWHLQIEAMKLAFADAHRYVADPDHVAVPSKGLLDPGYVAQRRALIGENALDPGPGDPPRGGTVYLCTADADGMMVSYIQSNYQGFGSGVVVPGTGISLENRGHGFSLEPGHPNLIAPGKRPYHTIIPGFLTHDGEPVGPFGVMGAEMQPQGHVQMIVNQVDHGMNPQTCLDAPRWRWLRGREVLVEPAVGRDVIAGLEARGHVITVADTAAHFNATGGRGQIIRRLPEGGYMAGSEPRSDGAAVGY